MIRLIRFIDTLKFLRLSKRIQYLPEGEFSKRYLEGKLISTHIDKNIKLYIPYKIDNSSIGAYTYISSNASISLTTIGKFCSIGPNLICGWGIHPINGISTSPMFYSNLNQNVLSLSLTAKIEEKKPIIIGNDVFIGANVTILDGVTIGHGAIIGAGSIVTKDIPPYAIAAGNPIQIIKYRFTEEQIIALLKINWWNFDSNQLCDIEKMFFDINTFINKYSND